MWQATKREPQRAEKGKDRIPTDYKSPIENLIVWKP